MGAATAILTAVSRALRVARAQPKDRRRAAELRGERVVFRALEREGFLERFRGARILEVGPKHGEDSLLLAGLEPSELVLVDLPQKRDLVRTWLPGVQELCPTRYVEANLLYLPPAQLRELGRFDLIWFTGVVYHNAEQLRFLRRLFRLAKREGAIVVESSTTRDPRLVDLNVVEIHWPTPYRDSKHVTHHPSRFALKSWLEMVGFAEVEIRDVYSKGTAWQRAVLTANRPLVPQPHVLFASEDGPTWVAGDAPSHEPSDDAPETPRHRPVGQGGRRSLAGTRQRLVGSLVGAATLAFMLLVFLPEELGDRPYDVLGLKF